MQRLDMSHTYRNQTFVGSLTIQRRVVHALILREAITRFGRENLGVLWVVAEPMIFTLGVAAVWAAIDMNHGSTIPIVGFAITGYSSVLLWRNAVARCNSGIQQNRNLLYHRNVRVFDVFVARITLEMTGTTASFITLTLVFVCLEFINLPSDPIIAIVGWVMLVWFGASLAVLIGAATAYGELAERIWHPASYLLFPFSGAAFMVDWLPRAGQEVVLYLPMVHGVEMLRAGFFGDVVKTHYDLGYTATINLLLSFAGLALLRTAAKRAGE